MLKKLKNRRKGLLTATNLVLMLTIISSSQIQNIKTVSSAELPTHFSISIIAPSGNPIRVQHAQLITNQMWKIGIDASLKLIGWDALLPRMFGHLEHGTYEEGGFDIGFIGWCSNPLPGGPYQFYHSSNI